ncbi:hypothetical protein JRQ81_017867 [Phrynocephalus forsythii]|uniref:A-kinase anchor 110kDa C-terminal domain-containing protein n=1 Tax=Phrynocephalus forsythii TaxID=171643 RepID=A0A9Q0XT49_9SAUR|nr:hypothetical protein JRQ81_017867 [Phrynocephalus forsythii]
MAGNPTLKVPPSNCESPLMYDASEHQSVGTDSSASSLGSSVTACKKVLFSNSLLESADYWLQNQRIPCQIGIVEDTLEKNYTSVCFVNLDAHKDDCDDELVKQRLMGISPNLPKLISSMNVQPPKENEIILLSGLASGNIQNDFELPQCSWLADVCLVQCARGNRKNSTNCIVFEINKFLIGLELVQEKQLHKEDSILKPEDDTNCSVSSIEEDFHTASEHFEDENAADDYNNGQENLIVTELATESAKCRGKRLENPHCKKGRLSSTLEADCISKTRDVPGRISSSSEEEGDNGEDEDGETTDKTTNQHYWKACLDGNSKPSINMEHLKDASDVSGNTTLTIMAPEEMISLDDTTAKQNSPLVTSDCNGEITSHFLIQNEQATAGEFATNLAESVLQDAFIRLSQSTFTKEAAVSISVDGNALSSSAYLTQDVIASPSWNELPRIVIVQTPDGSDNTSEWSGSGLPNGCSSFETESSAEVVDWLQNNSCNGGTESALEVALACAATVIGTISSPHATEKLKREQESMNSKIDVLNNEELEGMPSSNGDNDASANYSFPSALCGMTQVASAVAVCGLGEGKDDKHPVTSGGLLSAAETSAAITLHCSIAVGSSMENLNNSIAQVLFKEASLVLTRPEAYRSLGDFMESVNREIVQAVTKPSLPHFEEVVVDDLAQNLSGVILRHSVQEVRKKQRNASSQKCIDLNTQDIFFATVNKLLFNILYFTCKKMGDIAQLSECSDTCAESNHSDQVMESQAKETANDLLQQFSNYSSNKAFGAFSGTCPNKDVRSETNSVKVFKEEILPDTLHADSPARVSPHSSPAGKASTKKRYLKRTSQECYKSINPRGSNQTKKEIQTFTSRDDIASNSECRHGLELQSSTMKVTTENEEKHVCDAMWQNEAQLTLSLLDNQGFLPPQPLPHLKHPTDNYCITDFAEELAETVVSMATEIAAICLDNSNGKQPWFCAWKRGSEYLMPQALTCRTIKRKKEASSNGPALRKHRPPRLSEIKRKTDEHPELKERLMNRVMDESVNLDDTLDSSSSFGSEVSAKIMTLAELSVTDNIWQSPNHPRNRLHCDRWNRVNASSCESIPEEDADSKGSANTLGLINTLGQSISRTSSVSKQSSCESITDEFSRFMVNQMENEGRGFDLLLDYYAGKNASNILASALHQVAKKNGHLNVRPSCPSKQSSTESITEEFYKYMLREIEKDDKESLSFVRSTKDWKSSLLPPSQRSPFCFRQSSMPDSRSSASRLSVNAPIKANSLDGFSCNGHRDSLTIQPISTASSSGLCKSDSYLYQRGQTDQITDMLIHETWANSIRALMHKNKIIVDDGEAAAPDPHPHDSPPHVELYANRLAANIVESGKTLIDIHQDSTDKDSASDSSHIPIRKNNCSPIDHGMDLKVKKTPIESPGLFSINHTSSSACLRKVPLIQITDQREDLDKGSETIIDVNIASEKNMEHLNKDKPTVVYTGTQLVSSANNSLAACKTSEYEASVEAKATEESSVPLSSSDESTGSSWCQLVNDEDNPDDTSSFLQLSERSMSNGNSSTTSSLGIMDLDIYQENMPSSRSIHEIVEENTYRNKEPEKVIESTSGLCVATSGGQNDLLVINFDMEPDCPDAELRATLQWIAASELGIPTIYFKKSQENRIEKFLDVVQLVHQKSWKVGDIFHAVVEFCKLQEESQELTPSLFDWLLELG